MRAPGNLGTLSCALLFLCSTAQAQQPPEQQQEKGQRAPQQAKPPRVKRASAVVISSGCHKRVVQRVLYRTRQRIARCFQEQHARLGELQTQATLHLRLERHPRGASAKLRLTNATTRNGLPITSATNDALRACVTRAVLRQRYPQLTKTHACHYRVTMRYDSTVTTPPAFTLHLKPPTPTPPSPTPCTPAPKTLRSLKLKLPRGASLNRALAACLYRCADPRSGTARALRDTGCGGVTLRGTMTLGRAGRKRAITTQRINWETDLFDEERRCLDDLLLQRTARLSRRRIPRQLRFSERKKGSTDAPRQCTISLKHTTKPPTRPTPKAPKLRPPAGAP